MDIVTSASSGYSSQSVVTMETVLLLKFLHEQIAEFDKGIAPAAVTDQIVRVRMSHKVTASRMPVS